jgi:hypothetical protein
VTLEDPVDQLGDGVLVADVSRDRLRPPPFRLDRGHRLLERLRPAPAADHDRSEGGELARRRAPQAAARTGYQADMVGEKPRGEDP